MAKISKLEAAKRQLNTAVRMWFKNEDMLAIHTLSRAAFRILYDITPEGDVKKALKAHIERVGRKRFNEETNFLKHADQDPGDEIDEDFHVFTEAGIGMAIGLFKHHGKDISPEMASFLVWKQLTNPGFYDIPEEAAKRMDDFRNASVTDPSKITTQEASRSYGDAILHWSKLNWDKLRKPSDAAAAKVTAQAEPVAKRI